MEGAVNEYLKAYYADYEKFQDEHPELIGRELEVLKLTQPELTEHLGNRFVRATVEMLATERAYRKFKGGDGSQYNVPPKLPPRQPHGARTKELV